MTKPASNVLAIAGIIAFLAVVLLGLSAIGRGPSTPATQPHTQAPAPAPATLPNPPAPAPVPAAQQPPTNLQDMTTTASGLQYADQVIGTGAQPQAGQTVVVHYTGYLDNGTKFDSSLDANQPFEFVLGTGSVIRGWDEGLASMRVGGKRRLVIPPQLAYGEQGAGGVIPPNARLTFDVELLAVK